RHLQRQTGRRKVEGGRLVELERTDACDHARASLGAGRADSSLGGRDAALGGGERQVLLERDAPCVLERLAARAEDRQRERAEQPHARAGRRTSPSLWSRRWSHVFFSRSIPSAFST